MSFCFAAARQRFYREQEKLRAQYKALGMSEEQIQEMHQFDLHQFNRDTAFFRHTVPLMPEGETVAEDMSPQLKYCKDELAVYMEPLREAQFWWLDEIEDESLVERLLKLPFADLMLIDQLAFQGLSQEAIAQLEGKTQASVSQRIKTIRKKLKNPQ